MSQIERSFITLKKNLWYLTLPSYKIHSTLNPRLTYLQNDGNPSQLVTFQFADISGVHLKILNYGKCLTVRVLKSSFQCGPSLCRRVLFRMTMMSICVSI